LDVPRGSRLGDMKRAPTGVTDDIVCGEFSDSPDSVDPPGFVRALTWNIERGVRFDAILAFLRKCEADLILLQETDLNARRSAYRDVAHELAQSLCLNYVFGLQFQELSSPNGIKPAYQGLAALSPWPLSNGRVIRFRKQSKFWLPRPYIPQMEIFQRRLGGESLSSARWPSVHTDWQPTTSIWKAVAPTG
jgi:hypothetical protein